MRIGFTIPSLYAVTVAGNGVRNQALAQAESLRGLGHEVLLLDPWQAIDVPSLDVAQFFVGGFHHHRIETYRSMGMKLLVFAPIIDSNQPNWAYRLAARLGHVCGHVITVPGVHEDQARNTDLVVCRSRHEQTRITRGLGIDDQHVEIVPLGVAPPCDADPDEARRQLGLSGPFVLHVSNYTNPKKNTVRMAEAIGPTGIPLVLAGTAHPSPILSRLRELAEKHHNIRLLGYLEPRELCNMYAACKVLCLPSVHEGLGLAAMEAATYGADVVITKNGGAPDYFLDMAQYVDPCDTQDIRDAVVRAYQRPASDRLRQHLLKNFTWRQSAQKLVAAYEKHQRRSAAPHGGELRS